MTKILTATISAGATLMDRLIHFALGTVVAFCGLTLALPLLIGDLIALPGA
jgi:hypothetical protein